MSKQFLYNAGILVSFLKLNFFFVKLIFFLYLSSILQFLEIWLIVLLELCN